MIALYLGCNFYAIGLYKSLDWLFPSHLQWRVDLAQSCVEASLVQAARLLLK